MTTRIHTTQAWVFSLLCATVIAGCAPEAGDVQAEASHDEATGGVLTAISTEGTKVLLRTEQTPVQVGAVRFTVSFPDGIPGDVPVSLDLVSPEMPMMGIRRFEAQKLSDTEFVVDGEIMMDGFWNVYVNLGFGADAAEFEFDVEPSADGTGHDMSTMGMQDADSESVESGNSHNH